MKRKLIIFLLLLSIPLIAQTRKKKTVTLQYEDLSIDTMAVVKMDSITTPLLVDQSTIISVTNTNWINCYDTLGILKWKKQFPDKIAFLPVIDQALVLVGTYNGDLTKLKFSTGEILESVGIGDSITSNLLKISYQGNIELMIPKSTDSKSAVIFSTANGTLHCLDLETLQEYWTNHDSPGKIKSHLTIANNKLVFLGSDNFVYCVDAMTGVLIWRWKESDELSYASSKIFTDGSTLYLISSGHFIYAIDLLLGKLNWILDGLEVFERVGISEDKKNIYALTRGTQFLIVSAKDGKVTKQIPLAVADPQLIVSPMDYGKNIFAAVGSKLFIIDYKNDKIFQSETGSVLIDIQSLTRNKYILLTESGQLLFFKPRIN